MEREPLLYRTLSISQLSEIEPLLLASMVGGYMVTPYDFNNLTECNNEDDDNYIQVGVCLVYVCVCVWYIVYVCECKVVYVCVHV